MGKQDHSLQRMLSFTWVRERSWRGEGGGRGAAKEREGVKGEEDGEGRRRGY